MNRIAEIRIATKDLQTANSLEARLRATLVLRDLTFGLPNSAETFARLTKDATELESQIAQRDWRSN